MKTPNFLHPAGETFPLRLTACILALLPLALLLTPSPAASEGAWRLDVALPFAGGAATLRPVDEAAGLYEGELSGGGVLRLVRAPGETVGLLRLGGALHWVRVEEGVLVSAASREVVVPPHAADDQLFAPAAAPMATAPAPDGVLRLRVVADHPLYAAAGEPWAEHARRMVFLVGAILEAHFGIQVVAEHDAWRTPDPYGTPATLCGSGLLSRYRVEQETSRPVASNAWEVSHLLTGRSFTDAVGCGYVAQVETAFAYSATAVPRAEAQNLKRDTLIMVHEIGHNLAGIHERASPTPGSLLAAGACTAQPVSIMWPGCQTLEPPYFSDAHGLDAEMESLGYMRDGGNVPWMRAYALPRV